MVDCEALLAASYTLAGDATLNWSADIPIADWNGVTVEGDPPRVTRLDLPGHRYGLSGSIPVELGNLANLRELWLGDGNKLTGEIPPELGRLTRLEVLDLGLNKLSDGIPMWLGDMGDLRLLYLDGNQLIGEIPAGLGNLANLELLTLGNNPGLMGTLPQSMTRLTAIGTFTFHNTGLCAPLEERFQAWLRNIPDHEGPNCSPEPTATLTPTPTAEPTQLPTPEPTSTSTTADLVVNVDVTGNDSGTAWVFSYPDLPDALWFENEVYLPADAEVQFVLNSVDGKTHSIYAEDLFGKFEWEWIPDSQAILRFQTSGEQTVLAQDEHGNALKLFVVAPEEVDSTARSGSGCAERIEPPGAGLFLGAISDCRTLLSARDTLVGDGGPLNWDLDTLFFDWDGVWWKETRYRRSDGGRYASYKVGVLDLAGQGLSGRIPPEIGQLSELGHLDLSDNQLTGSIPPELGELTNLRVLSIRDNNLTGCIPEALTGVDGDLSGLPFCSETTPSATPTLTPSQSPCVTRGVVTDAADNPGLVSDCDALLAARDILVGSESLNWSADTPIEYWDGVTVDGTPQRVTGLDLYYHWRLAGEIPAELGNLTNLKWLRLHGPGLTGEIPAELGNLTNLLQLELAVTGVTGKIPAELGNLTNLRVLHISNNGRLTGEIPAELGNLINLTRLDIYYNGRLTGEIPAELGNLTNLTELRLSANGLAGEIPTELGNLTNLKVLNLVGESQLSGCLPEAVLSILPNLSRTDIGILPFCTGENVVVSADGDPQTYNDNVFVLPVAEDLATGSELPWSDYAMRFFEYFDDEFDFLIFVFHVKNNVRNYAGRYQSVKNDVEGIGVEKSSDGDRYGSAGKLQGVIDIINFSQIARLVMIHELMHRWANYIIPTGREFHWGFSSANGRIGGFDIVNLVSHGDSRYSAGIFFPGDGVASKYSPIELYLAGFIPPEEVPDLWVAEDGDWLRTEDGRFVRADNGNLMFTASKVRTYTIEDIIEEHGERNPDYSQAQRDFRAAAILIIDENLPATKWVLDYLSDGTRDFADNFYEATGGRATITMDGLSQFWKGGR